MTTDTKKISFTDKLTNLLMPIAEKLEDQRHITALKRGMMTTIPLTIIGALFLVLAQPPVDVKTMQPTNIFFQFLLGWKSWATANQAFLLTPYYLTIGIISIYTAFTIAYFLAQQLKLNALNHGVQSTLVFLSIAAVPGMAEKSMRLPMTYLDAKGMFTAILVGLLTVEISHFLIKHNIKIKMPASVPPMVSAPFEILISIGVNITFFMILNLLIQQWTGSGLVNLVQTIFSPLIGVSGSVFSIMFINIIMTTFWFLGIHGGSVVSAVVTPITTLYFTENSAAYQAGQAIPHVFAGSYNTMFGGWITYPALLVALLLVAKSPILKSLSRAASVPTLFNINEPMIFGLPIVMNVMLIIPTYICTAINIFVSYLLMENGIVGKIVAQVPFSTPGPIGVFLSTLDWKNVVLWFVLLAINVLICIPFVIGYDKRMAKLND